MRNSFLNSMQTKSIFPLAVVLCLLFCAKPLLAYELETPRLSQALTLSGDYNHDHIVDLKDYTVWRDMLGHKVEPGAGADGDWNGVIELADYEVWHKNFGNTVSPIKALEVPVPAALQLSFCIGVLFCTNISYRRRRGRLLASGHPEGACD